MANEINIGIKLTSNIKEEVKDADKLRASLERASKVASSMGGTSGSRMAAAKARPAGMSEGEYSASRGTAGLTGASARDFANQAQGLGGLVRLYATVAANTFAAVSAFNALKNAADTTNMVQGLNQLGAGSGIALGSLAQNLVKVTDSTISFREAMEATAKGTTAGLSTKQMKELAIAAKNTSQTLGIGMSDALSRLTRGITKLEPELLDELGLFTKVGKATEDYARSVGKSEASLTDFEKRQAFANAVLKESRDKYGDIDIAANPYQQLEASIRNLTTAGLELINKFLTPFASVLASNTTALGAVLALIGGKLLKMAIPALSTWRDELVKSAEIAKDKARSINESFGEKFVERTYAAFKIPELQKNLLAAEVAYAKSRQKFLDIDNNYKQKSRAKVYQAVSTGDITPETLGKMQKEINAKTREGTEASLRHAEALKLIKAQYAEILAARTKLTDAENKAQALADKPSWEEKQRMKISRRAGARAERLGILSQIGGDVQAGGLSYGLDTLSKRVADAKDMGSWDKLRTKITGTFIAGATSAGILINSLSNIAGAVAAAVAVYSLLAMVFSKNEREVSAFKDQLESLKKTTENTDAVMKKFGEPISSNSIIAKANNLQELSDGVDELADKLQEADKKASWFDRLIDTKEFGLKAKFAENASEAIASQLKVMDEGPAKEAFKSKIMEIFSIGGTDQKSIQEGIANLSNDTVVATTKKVNALGKALVNQQKEQANTARGVVEALKAGDVAAQNLLNTLVNNDPLTKYGAELVNIGTELTKAFGNGKTAIAAIQDVLKNPKALKLIDPEGFQQLMALETNLPQFTEEVAKYQERLSSLYDTESKMQQALADPKLTSDAARKALESELARVQSEIGQTKIKLEVSTEGFKAIESKIKELSEGSIKRGYDLIEKNAQFAAKQGAIALQKALIGGISGPGMSQAQAKLNIADINIQKEQVSIVAKLNETMLQNNLIGQQANALKEAENIRAKAKTEGRSLSSDEESTIAKFEKQAGDFGKIITAVQTGKSMSGAQAAALSPEAQGSALQLKLLRSGSASQLATLNARAEQERIQGILGAQKELQAEKDKEKASEAAIAGLMEQKLSLSLQNRDYLTDAEMATKQTLESTKASADQEVKRAQLNGEIAEIQNRIKYATGETKTYLQQTLDAKQKNLTQLDTQLGVEETILKIQQEQARISNTYARNNSLREDAFRIGQQDFALQEAKLSSATELLAIQQQMGMIMPQEVLNREKALKTQQSAVMYAKEMSGAENAYAAAINVAKEGREKALAADPTADVSYWNAKEINATTYYQNELRLINQNNEARNKSIELQYSLSDRQKAYGEIFKNTFEGMADAMVEWAQTGKLNSKELFNSLIADIARYEMRLQTLEMYKSLKPGLMSLIPSIFGASAPVNGAAAGTSFFMAKGGVYDAGLQMFAKGGMFTNSIVSSPTLFKFAQGTGLMGEAGPEAIMPLKRDANGNLGVRAGGGGGNVEVVVNNYGNDQATTRETKDDKGNRRIEVIIGEAASGEISRTGSSSQGAMRNTYGIAPKLIRR